MNNNLNIEKLKFPIGKFENPNSISKNDLDTWIKTIENFPSKVITRTASFPVTELNWIYRPNGWSIKQVVHHCADSHSNAFIRFKLALTEDVPTIKPYEEALWAALADGTSDDISYSLQIIAGVHARWVLLLKSLGEKELKRQFFHPANLKTSSLEETIGVYAWHCNHHFAHIEQALRFKGQF
jgi:DinB superfamily